tara:strand:- start:86 stop:1027 length:942 start_codon:yes stop_codon:yes gene_type:complete
MMNIKTFIQENTATVQVVEAPDDWKELGIYDIELSTQIDQFKDLYVSKPIISRVRYAIFNMAQSHIYCGKDLRSFRFTDLEMQLYLFLLLCPYFQENPHEIDVYDLSSMIMSPYPKMNLATSIITKKDEFWNWNRYTESNTTSFAAIPACDLQWMQLAIQEGLFPLEDIVSTQDYSQFELLFEKVSKKYGYDDFQYPLFEYKVDDKITRISIQELDSLIHFVDFDRLITLIESSIEVEEFYQEEPSGLMIIDRTKQVDLEKLKTEYDFNIPEHLRSYLPKRSYGQFLKQLGINPLNEGVIKDTVIKSLMELDR